MSRAAILAATLAVAITAAAWAQEAEKLEPKALEILRQMCAYYGKVQNGEGAAQASLNLTMPGAKEEQQSDIRFAFSRPASFRFAIQAKGGEVLFVSDGKKMFVRRGDEYVELDAPSRLARMTDSPVGNAVQQAAHGGFMLMTLLGPDAYGVMTDGVMTARYVGIEDVGGAECHHLAFTQEEVDWDVWASSGDKPLLVAERADLSRLYSEVVSQDVKGLVNVTYRDWQVDQGFPEGAFAFVPPEGAKKVEMPEEPTEALVGKPAPDFTARLLDGAEMTLAGLKGKSVVILDFWATWCPPCQEALPVIAKVAKDYADKGVVLYAVNQGEDAETIKAFLDKAKVSVTVALDPEGAIGEKYMVEGIPQTVIVDKNGVVQVVHVGFSPALAQELPRQLDAILAGRGPAAAE